MNTKVTHHNGSSKIVSLNVRGLNTHEKRLQILLSMRKLRADIVLLQETHFKTGSTIKLLNSYYPSATHATSKENKTKGVSILLTKHCPFQITDSLSDVDGRFLFLKGLLYGKRLTLANIYAPNVKQVPLFRNTLQKLADFQEGSLILGGDFNIPMNPLTDTSSGTSKLPFKALCAIKKLLQELSLHDTWGTLYPNVKDYTFYSAPHNCYSRLDYLFIS